MAKRIGILTGGGWKGMMTGENMPLTPVTKAEAVV